MNPAAPGMALSPLDDQRLHQALVLAREAIGLSDPNPRVGCVLGRADGEVLGTGFTQQAGGPHAEVMALRDALALGQDVRGTTAWVTLEPCAHHGSTPPCCDALIAAGITRVVVAVVDPHVKVAGRGIQRLRDSGVVVEVAEGAIAAAARDLNVGFFARCERGRPWVRLKAAASLDGRTALPDGTSQWITGTPARADGHGWRKRAGALLTGIGTALRDDPRLDVRHVPTTLQPLRVIVDSGMRLPPGARLLAPPGKVLLVTATDETGPRAHALRVAGAEILVLAGADGRVDLPALMQELGRRGVNELHVEAGAALNGALLGLQLVDELLLYLAPMFVGSGRGIADLPAALQLSDCPRFEVHEMHRVGEDIRLRLRRNTVGQLDTIQLGDCATRVSS